MAKQALGKGCFFIGLYFYIYGWGKARVGGVPFDFGEVGGGVGKRILFLGRFLFVVDRHVDVYDGSILFVTSTTMKVGLTLIRTLRDPQRCFHSQRTRFATVPTDVLYHVL